MTPILRVAGLSKRFGGLAVSQDVSLTLEAGEIHALIGPNGAGKTTLLDQIGGQLRPDAGTIALDGTDITSLAPAARARLGLQRIFQVPRIFASFSVAENPAVAAIGGERHSFGFWRPLRETGHLRNAAATALAAVGLPVSGQPAAHLSHGDRRLLELAMLLTTPPKVILLDEPMAGLGRDESQSMIALLRKLKGGAAMLLVEHDMDAVFRLADRISVLVAGRVIASGPPGEVRGDAAVRSAYLGHGDV